MHLLEKFLSEELKIKETDLFLKLFSEYQTLLLEWNYKINLISRKSDSIENHILNSIFFLTKYPLTGKESIVDVGTGGGFPGIPLKILYPELSLILLDSITKKTMVLEDITQKLGLDAVILSGRAEEISLKPNFNGNFEVVISKAVSTLENLYQWTNKFLSDKGKMICIKGGDITKELGSFNVTFPGIHTETIDYSFPSEYNIEDKKIVVINK